MPGSRADSKMRTVQKAAEMSCTALRPADHRTKPRIYLGKSIRKVKPEPVPRSEIIVDPQSPVSGRHCRVDHVWIVYSQIRLVPSFFV